MKLPMNADNRVLRMRLAESSNRLAARSASRLARSRENRCCVVARVPAPPRAVAASRKDTKSVKLRRTTCTSESAERVGRITAFTIPALKIPTLTIVTRSTAIAKAWVASPNAGKPIRQVV